MPELVKSRNGSVLLTSSVAAHIAQPLGPHQAYGVAKAALETLTRQLALTYARDGVRVNALQPGCASEPSACC